jgi:hypothetical protein
MIYDKNKKEITMMIYPEMNDLTEQNSVKVSISARLIAALVYLIPVLGGALSSLFLINVMRAMKNNEAFGRGAVFAALTKSMFPSLGGLYLGILGGVVVIIILIVRFFMQTKTTSPSLWFFILCSFLFLVPSGLFFEAQSMIIEVFISPVISTGIGGIASNINLLLILSVAAMLFIAIFLIVMSVVPFKTISKPKWSPLIGAIILEILMIAAAVAFQLRFLWLFNGAKSD